MSNVKCGTYLEKKTTLIRPAQQNSKKKTRGDYYIRNNSYRPQCQKNVRLHYRDPTNATFRW